jgi:malonyl CoA-acyl carrier protein transacylase/NAD(P)-dependent dehydrogenase (short-subunit alcohol dehydrogenase family)/acyl carrier protein
MVLAMRHGLIPSTLHVDTPSTQVDWTAGAVQLATEPTAWPETGRARRAGVSSFGISGTNAHVLLEQAPPAEIGDEAEESGLAAWTVSARSLAALADQVDRLRSFAETAECAATDVGFSLATGRSTFEHRAVLLADGRNAREVARGVAVDRGVVFVFSGQGSQRVGMGRELYARYPVFAEAFDEVCVHLEVSLDEECVESTGRAQPALFAVEVALFRLLASWGVCPDYLIGHSVGEITAAYVAGVLSLGDACRLVAARARLMQTLPEGGVMVAVRATEAEVASLLSAEVSLAAVNGPDSVVLSGPEDAVRAAAVVLEAEGRKVTELHVSHAFHSTLMRPMLAQFRAVAETLSFSPPEIQIVSTVTGTPIDEDRWCSPEYWVEQVEHTVRFADALSWAGEHGVSAVLEVGPGGGLAAVAPEILGNNTISTALLRADRDEQTTALTAIAHLHVHGVPVDWTTLYPGARKVDVPTYPFQHKHFWPRTIVGVRRQQDQIDQWRYRVSWTPLASATATSLPGTWLLLIPVEPSAWTDPIVDTVTEAADDVLSVSVKQWERGELAAALNDVGPVAGVVSLLGFEGSGVPPSPGVPAGVVSTVTLVQALGDAGIDAPLWCLTSGAVAVDAGDPAPNPERAAIWGLGRVAALEYPPRWGGLVDLPATPCPDAVARLVDVLVGDAGEDQVALRATGAWGRRLVPAPVDTATAAPVGPQGTVLVTGGTGALGAHVARWLARLGTEHLLLVSRRGPAASGADDLTEELTGLGARVTVAACDIADRAALDALIAAIPAEHPLTGVVHTAGVPDDGALADLGVAELARVMSAKVAGAVNLDAALAGRHLDLFVVFSSIAGVWGSGGQGAYGAANAYLDALVEQRRSRGLAATSVAWGAWAQGGMTSAEGAVDYLQRRGVVLIDPERAIAALERAVIHADTAVTVADVDWQRFVPVFTAHRPSPLLHELPQFGETVEEAAGDRDVASPLKLWLAELSAAERAETLLELVRDRVAAVLGYPDTDEIGPDRPFNDLGVDSVTAVELRTTLAAATGLGLSATLVFDHPTPSALATHLEAALLPSLAGTPEVDEEEVRVRAALTSIPLGQLRQAGLLDLLLRLTDADPDAESSPAPSGGADSIDDMDAEDLLRLATGELTD